MKPNIHRGERVSQIAWYALNAFLVVYPLSEVFRLNTRLPAGILNVVLFTGFCLFLLLVELKTWGNRQHLLMNPTTYIVEWVLLLFIVFAVLATIHSVNAASSIFGIPGEYGGFVPIISYVILFVWVVHRVHRYQHRQLIRTMVLASIVPTLYGILQHMHHIPGVDYAARSFSLFCNADFFGAYMSLMMILTLTLYITEPKRYALAYLILITVQSISITFSSTRSAWLGEVIGAALFLTAALVHRLRLWRRFLLVTCVLGACFLLLNHLSNNMVALRASSIATNAQQVVTNHDSNYAGSRRWYIWKESLPLIASHPILGTGPDTFQQVFQPPQSGAEKYLNGQPIANANNAYFQVAVTLGTPALAFLITFYAIVIIRGLRSLRQVVPKHGAPYLLIIGLLSTGVCYLVQAFFNMDVVMVAPMFWIVLASLYSCSVQGVLRKRPTGRIARTDGFD